MEQSKKKSMLVTVICSVIIPGTGHIYAGDKKKGIPILALFLSAFILFSLEANHLMRKGILDPAAIEKVDEAVLKTMWAHIILLITGVIAAFVILIWALASSVKICGKANRGEL